MPAMTVEHAAALLAAAERVLVLTGAGISAESGVPTFRGPDGLWQGVKPEELATAEAFVRDARRCWEWYGWRREKVAACRPNPAHRALAEWMLRREGITLVTQNVDGLHERAAAEVAEAGARPEDASRALPIRLHGSIFGVRCTRCSHRSESRRPIDATSTDTLPRCPDCESLLRPDVVWFGEMLPESALGAASEAAGSADACLVIGTQGAVYPAAGLAFQAQREGGALLIVVDPADTAFDSSADVRIRAPAARVVPDLVGPRSTPFPASAAPR